MLYYPLLSIRELTVRKDELTMIWIELLSTLSEEDRDFVTWLYETYGDTMYSTALHILKNDHDAQYAVSDIMYSIMMNLSKYKNQSDESIRNQLTIYIRCTIKNISINAYNKRKRIWSREASMYYYDDDTDEAVDFEYEDTSFDLEDFVIGKTEIERVKTALLQLPEELQDTVNLVCICGYNSFEAARVLKIKPDAVRARIFRIRKKLRELMGEEIHG